MSINPIPTSFFLRALYDSMYLKPGTFLKLSDGFININTDESFIRFIVLRRLKSSDIKIVTKTVDNYNNITYKVTFNSNDDYVLLIISDSYHLYNPTLSENSCLIA